MEDSEFHLDFERPIAELEEKIRELSAQSERDKLDLETSSSR